MRQRPRLWWSVYGACALLVLGALAWISAVALDLERAEARARVEVGHEQSARLALWRMDSWLAPILAAEAARPVEDYTAYRGDFDLHGAWTRSPLVDFRSRHVRLHFEVVEGRGLTSPQAPPAVWRDEAVAGGVPAAFMDANDALVRELAPTVDAERLRAKVEALEARMADVVREELGTAAAYTSPVANGANGSWVAEQQALGGSNAAGLARRQQNMKLAREPVVNCAPVGTPGETLRIGPLVGVWIEATERELAFVRRVTAPDTARGMHESVTPRPPVHALQGFLVDWDALEEDLLEQVSDLFPGARLVPVPEERTADDTTGRVLATVPVALEVGPPPAVATVDGPTGTTLWITWAAVLAALAVAGVTLHASIGYGERRSRFASTVSHELRTPLTTFRMYAEMLSDGMVTDPARQREYLQTLHAESERLTSVVENVLAYSRLEQGRAAGRVERVPLAALLERLRPRLERRAEDAGVTLALDTRGPLRDALSVDVEAVGQILLNLVDNACKYGTSSGTSRVDVAVEAPPGRLRVTVRDHGPGIEGGRRRAVFAPFERAGRDDGSVPGIGLGLALSRGLARQLGGDLVLDAGVTPGACFVLDVPA